MDEFQLFFETSASGYDYSDDLICSYVDPFGSVVNLKCKRETEECCGKPTFYWCCERSDLVATNEVIIGISAAAVIIFVFFCVFFVYCVLSVPVWCRRFGSGEQPLTPLEQEQLEMQQLSGRYLTDVDTPLMPESEDTQFNDIQ